jgi:ribonuclease HI
VAEPLSEETKAVLLFKIISYLSFPSPGKEVTEAIMIFNSTVWSQRCTFFSTLGTRDSLTCDSAASRIAKAAVLAYKGATTATTTRFGNASTRTPAQKAAARAYAQGLLDAVKEGSAVAFTDGSALNNPGPAGAGCLLWVKGLAVLWEHFLALGPGSNNLAEIWAVGMALGMVRRLPPEGRPYPLVIFTDSQFTIDVIQGKSTSKDFATHVYNVRSNRDALVEAGVITSLTLVWVPGHAGLAENDQADFLANKGSEQSQRKKGVIDRPTCLRQRLFIPRREEPPD